MNATATVGTSRVALLVLSALIVVAYLPGLGGGYIFDDRPNITANLAVQVAGLNLSEWWAAILSSPASNFPRPLSMLSFAINHFFTGLDPVPMKVTNVLIHVVNTLLVFRLARELHRVATRGASNGQQPWFAVFIAAIWGLHPINVMAVLYVVQRMESLSHLFVFAGLIVYLDGRRRLEAGLTGSWPRILGGLLGCTVLGVAAKESAALLPAYAFGIELCLLRFKGGRPADSHKLAVAYGMILLIPAVLAIAYLLPPAMQPNPFPWRNFDLAERLMTEARVVCDYFQWTLYPNLQQMSIYQDDYSVSRGLLSPPSTLFAILFLTGLATVALALTRRRPLLALGIIWFLSAHLMTATIIPLELVFEHRNYFASLGICIALADLLLLIPVKPGARQAGAAFAGIFLIAFAAATALRSWEWRDPLSFAISEAAKRPHSPRAVYALGVALANFPELRADSPIAQAAFDHFERARQLPDSNMLPDQASIILAARLGIPIKDEWWLHMQDRLGNKLIGPQEEAALAALTECAIIGKCDLPQDRMLETFRVALSRNWSPEVNSMLGNYMLNEMHQPDIALYLWGISAQARPNEPQYRVSLIKLLIFMRRDDEAKEQIKVLRKLGKFGQYNRIADEMDARRKSSLPGPGT